MTGPIEAYRFTQAELLAMAQKRFGEDPTQWKFICPACNDIATPQDFIDAGADPQLVGQECIGRSLGALAKPEPTNERGCNWCAYGLFRGPWIIVLPDGKEVGSFKLARLDEVH